MVLRVAVDFGTLSTCAAMSVAGVGAQLVTVDGAPLVPSAVYAAADGSDAGLPRAGRPDPDHGGAGERPERPWFRRGPSGDGDDLSPSVLDGLLLLVRGAA